VLLAPAAALERATIVVTLVSLLLTGALAARTGGAPVARGALRLVFWGSLAMLATNLVGRLFGSPV
jgi:VIT1/CCC1 family predicted Fe2+/Mn2+ transporter